MGDGSASRMLGPEPQRRQPDPGDTDRSADGEDDRLGVRAATSRGLAWLTRAQLPSGEFPSFASPLPASPESWTLDSLNFVTALVVIALNEIDDELADAAIDRAITFLDHERETMSQWRYWSTGHPRYALTPPDADDTACCSMAVSLRGVRTRSNRVVLGANRDASGRFYTWIIPRRGPRDPRALWAVRDGMRRSVRDARSELWATTEARADDVDGVVNANVVRYLGDGAPEQAVEWIVSIIESHREDTCDSWHRNRFTMYAAIADGMRRGVRGYTTLRSTIIERIIERIGPNQTVGSALDSAHALLALTVLGGPTEPRDELAAGLIRTQRANGSWHQSVFYFGGPNEVFGWSSEALTTATALGALAAHVRHAEVRRRAGRT